MTSLQVNGACFYCTRTRETNNRNTMRSIGLALLATLSAPSTGLALALPPLLDRVVSPAIIRLEKFVASQQIPDAVTVPGRLRLDECSATEASDDAATSGAAVDHSVWDEILRAHTSPGGEYGGVKALAVDYRAVSADPRFDAYLETLAAAPSELAPAEQLALFMNAYNALCIGLIVSHLRSKGELPKSINDLTRCVRVRSDVPSQCASDTR